MFRLHIDIPVGTDEQKALELSKQILASIEVQNILNTHKSFAVDIESVFQYRVSNDTDRRMNNYLIKDENNHCAGRKIRIELKESEIVSDKI